MFILERLRKIVQNSNSKDELFYNIIMVYMIISISLMPILVPTTGISPELVYYAFFIGMFLTSIFLFGKVDVDHLFSRNRKIISKFATPVFFIVFLLVFVICMQSPIFSFMNFICLAGSGGSVVGGVVIVTSRQVK